jgi:predicted RNA binding protein YcfA (HicA-like mRNA interferase family)
LKVRIFKQLLKENGWEFIRHGKGDHEIWGKDGMTIPVDGSGGTEIPIGTLKAMLRQTQMVLEFETKKTKAKP